ncbi:MAG: hypothetical protein MUE73_04265 [Planctomycetes bacterium]|jgi:tetratricopeptide (TPR) repeat protein|nr:hypothetical protein [Planctomycetota bacterium]
MRTAALVLLLLSVACESSMQSADDALLRGDYDRAVALYEKAIEEGRSPESTERARVKLEAARARAGMAHLAQSRRLAGEKRWDAAFAEAEAAWRLNPADSSRAQLEEMRAEYSKSLRTQANAAMRDGRTDDAARILEEAERVEPDPRNRSLLDAARRESKAWHEESFAPALAVARAAREAREWERACLLYEEAHRHGRTTESTKEAGFCARMRDAERAGSIRDERQARLHFESALSYGFDTGFVRSRMDALLPGEWTIVVHGASILPFRPSDQRPWDHDRTAPMVVPGAGEFLGSLPAFRRATAGGDVPGLMRAVETMRGGPRDPDCFPVVVIPGQRVSGVAAVRQDSLNPVWDFRAVIRARSTDEFDVRIGVFDLDEQGREEEIGAWRATFAELLENPGPRTLLLFGDDGQLLAGGLLALRVSTTAGF